MFDNEVSLCHFLILTLFDRVLWVHCKKRLAIFPSQGEFCKDIIPGWDGKIAYLFLQCNFGSRCHSAVHAFPAGDHSAELNNLKFTSNAPDECALAQYKFFKKSTDFFYKINFIFNATDRNGHFKIFLKNLLRLFKGLFVGKSLNP